MDIFKQGKKVSLRNVVKKNVEQEARSEDSQLIDFEPNITASEVMRRYSDSQALAEFYQFLCGTG